MTLERLNPGPRMSQAVRVGDVAERTRQVPAKIDAVGSSRRPGSATSPGSPP